MASSSSSSSSPPLQLCLTSSTGGNRQIVSISGSAVASDLYALAQQQQQQQQHDATCHVTVTGLRYGFPPRSLSETSTVPLSDLLHNMDRITVEIAVVVVGGGGAAVDDSETQTPSHMTTTSTSTDSSTTTGTKRRPQRAAAKAATESFADVIQAQDELLKPSLQNKKSSSSSSPRNKNKKKRSKPASGPATLRHGGGGPTRPRSSKPPKALPGPGRRLANGHVVSNVGSGGVKPPPPRGPRRRTSSNTPQPWSSTDDISFALLGALSSGSTTAATTSSNKRGGVSHVLRGAMKQSVAHAYDESQAIAKVAAVQSQQYTIHTSTSTGATTNATTDDCIMTVQYSKGLQGRGTFTETVHMIDEEALRAVVTAIAQSEQRDLLRPLALAYQSPRVYWNLVRLCAAAATSCNDGDDTTTTTTTTTNSVTSTNDALKWLLPQLDWSFLQRRPTKLSEKALENQRQQQQQQEEDMPNTAAAQEAVAAVEQAMEQLQQHDATRRRERAARAALARTSGRDDNNNSTNSHNNNSNSNSNHNTPWTLVTPSELDEDELKECLGQSDFDMYGTLLISHKIHNWRELANADASQLAEVLHAPSSRVEEWMTRAQQESMDEIMVEVCDDNMDTVAILREEARTGTLKDLSHWKHMPDILYGSAPSLQSRETGATVPLLRQWCDRAQRVLDAYEWTTWYATPVD